MSKIGNMSFDALKDYVARVATKTINNGQEFNTVHTGVIQQSLPGYYTVTLSNSNDTTTYNAVPLNSADAFGAGDHVYLVKAPVSSGDNFNTKYYVFGLVSSTNEVYANLSDWERFMADVEKDNLLSGIDLTLKGFGSTTTEVFLDTVSSTGAEDPFFKNINDKGLFAIKADFSCDGSNSLVDYGLRVKCLNNEGNICITAEGVKGIYDLGTGWFSGQPFNMNGVTQKRVIYLDNFTTNVAQFAIYGYIVPQQGKSFSLPSILAVDKMSLQAGSIQDISGRFTVRIETPKNGKDYFRSISATEKGQDVVSLQATPYYDSQPLSADAIQYYWFVKDEAITEGSKQYNSLAGKGWRCLNQYTEESIIGAAAATVKVWDNKNNIIHIDEKDWEITNQLGRVFGTKGDWTSPFGSYETIVKCIVKYQGSVAKSSDYIIYNYAVHNFQAVLSSTSEKNRLVLPSDKITYSCSISDYNECAQSESHTERYTWIILGKISGEEDWRELANLAEFSTQLNSIQIRDSEETVDNSATTLGTRNFLEYELPNKTEDNKTFEKFAIQCRVQIAVDAADDAITLESNIIEIESITELADDIKTVYVYKYYISPNMNVSFGKAAGDWVVYDSNAVTNPWTELKQNSIWLEDNELDSENPRKAFDFLSTNCNFSTQGNGIWPGIGSNYKNSSRVNANDRPYLYYSRKEYLYLYRGSVRTDYNPEDGVEITPVEEKSWETPVILRQVQLYADGRIIDQKEAAEIDQINVFNQLTKNGAEDGIFYQEEAYIPTEDTSPQTGKEYYTKNGTSYNPYTGETFSANTVYYEKSSNKNKLYINATYINSGTLRVGDSLTEKFYASIHNPEVRIGGYSVSNTDLKSTDEKVGLSSTGSYALWAGNSTASEAPFRVTHGGDLYASNADISGDIHARSLTLDSSIIIGGNNLAGGSGNLAATQYISWQSMSTSSRDSFKYTGLSSSSNKYGGLCINNTNLEVGKKYVLSYKFKITSGDCTRIAGHLGSYNSSYAILDGVKQTGRYPDGYAPLSGNKFTLNQTYQIEIYLTKVPGSDHTIYIQTTRNFTADANGQLNQVGYEIWDIQLEEGEAASHWKIPLEDSDLNSEFIVTGDRISMRSKSIFMEGGKLAIYSPNLQLNWNPGTYTGTKWESGKGSFENGYFAINTNNFSVSKDGTITSTKGKIGNWNISTNTLSAGSGTSCIGFNSSSSSGNVAIWAGASEAEKNGAPFSVTNTGRLVAENAIIKGDLYATSLVIDGEGVLKNLAQLSKTSFYGVHTGIDNYVRPSVRNYKYTASGNRSDDAYPGVCLASSIFEDNTDYILSFKFSDNKGSSNSYDKITRIGGHSSAFRTNKVIIDGIDVTESFKDGRGGISFANGAELRNTSQKEHSVKVFLTRLNAPTGDTNLYIQMQRGGSGGPFKNYFSIWDIAVYKGTIDNVWIPPEADEKSSSEMIKEGHKIWKSSSYCFATPQFAQTPVEGSMYTIIFKSTFDTSKIKYVGVYNSGGYIAWGEPESDGDNIYHITVCWRNSNYKDGGLAYTVTPTHLNFYGIRQTGTSPESPAEATLEWVTMVPGIRSVPKGAEINTFFKVDPTNGNITLSASNTLELTSGQLIITSDNFSLTSAGVLTAKSGTIGGFTLGDAHIFAIEEGEMKATMTGGKTLNNALFAETQSYTKGMAITSYGLYATGKYGTGSKATAGGYLSWFEILSAGYIAQNIRAGTIRDWSADNDGNWVYHGTGLDWDKYIIVATPRMLDTLSSAQINVCLFIDSDGTTRIGYRYTGSLTTVCIDWLAIPRTFFEFDMDTYG